MYTFLELLEREASAVEFEGPILAARESGAPAEHVEELERAKLSALRVRAMLSQRARRGAELSALFETAGDLAGMRDLDDVLAAIVLRARQLLKADIAYMTLRDDERGDNYMRVTDGATSPRFRSCRLPMGTGLGGLVAQTATPYHTSDYFADEQYLHSGDIDAAVGEEGLVAIVGVPLRLGRRVIGVLFAADRRVRHFDQQEIALLGSLAAHAAVAIDNARLLQETRTALSELSEANTATRAHSDSVERAALAHERMADLVLRGGGIEDVAAMVTEVLGGALTVLDSNNHVLAGVGEMTELSAKVFDSAKVSCSLGRTVRVDDLAVASIEVEGEQLCTLVLRADVELADTDQRILERAALVTALLLLFRRSMAEAESRFRGELLDDLISDSGADPESLRERARRVGADLDATHVLVVVRHEGRRERAAFWAASDANMVSGLAAIRDREVVMLVPGDKPGATARRIATELSQALSRPATAGACGPVTGTEGVAAAYRQAQRCADTLVALGRSGHGADIDELGFVSLLVGDGRDASVFVADTIGAVVDYDARRGTALVDTLAEFFGAGGSLNKAAECLHVHVNTVTQRLDRVGGLLGSDWRKPDRALEIQLALRLHRLRGVL